MKTLLKLSFVALLLVSTSSYAQTFKFGHINMQTLVQLMPETDSANVALEKYGKDLEETFQGMQKEFQTKYETYQQKQTKLKRSDFVASFFKLIAHVLRVQRQQRLL